MWCLGIFGRINEEICVVACRKGLGPVVILNDQAIRHDEQKITMILLISESCQSFILILLYYYSLQYKLK